MSVHLGVNPHELMIMVDALSREKGIEREDVLQAMEVALSKAVRTKYGNEHDICVEIDRRTCDVNIYRLLQVVEGDPLQVSEISLKEALKIDDDAKVGEALRENLPPIAFDRIAAQTARGIVIQKIKDAEKTQKYNEFKEREGDIITGVVKRADFGNVIVDIGRVEAILRLEHLIPRENFRVGDRIKAYVVSVALNPNGVQIVLSRTHENFLLKLLMQEVPELVDGTVQVKGIVRDPGSRAKVAVYTEDPAVDPVGTCIGIRGSRIQSVTTELQGERIDVVLWSNNPAAYLANALAPAEVTKIVMDEETRKLEVVVPDAQLSLAIGRRGQNVKLASQITKWGVDIVVESKYKQKLSQEKHKLIDLYKESLDIEEELASLLINNDLTSIEDIADMDAENFVGIDGFNEAIINDLRAKAEDYLVKKEQALQARFVELGGTEELANLSGVTIEMLIALVEGGVKTLDDIGRLDTEELMEILGPYGVSTEEAGSLIMAVRDRWFNNSQSAEI